MRSFWKSIIITSLALALPALAGSPSTTGSPSTYPGGCQWGAPAYQATGIADPYSIFLSQDLNSPSLEIERSYQIDLKSLRANDMSLYQTVIHDTRGPGAGYSSPYLWEAGNTPGSSSAAPRWSSPFGPLAPQGR